MESVRIVVVEDEVFIRLDLVSHLEAGGYQVVGTAESAAGALEQVGQKKPDLVLMDIRLVGPRDGIEAAIEIWKRFSVRCLFVSANLDSASRERAVEANPAGFLEKPFTRNGLLGAVSEALQ